ncbi:hypothetical protein LSCM1_06454 [Leishmania martiniquensis]|uniref:Uncharacterized protein n=1 Tax=Leishmania martiniquensis TaxID=1580590 RepID=A0A836HER6_9TRYP|nr:hypothetical protein LSCM1_06454 [Leishmania martiniquensis]
MDTTTDSSTLGAASARMWRATNEKSTAAAFKGDGDTTSLREALEASDEDTTNPYDGPREEQQSRSESGGSSTTSVGGYRSGSRSETGPSADAAAATITGGKSALSDEAGSSAEVTKRPTYSYQATQTSLKVVTLTRNTVAQEPGPPTSANTSAAFPEEVSKVVELSTPTPPRSNFVGGPGGPHRSGPGGAGARTPGSPLPSAPQADTTSALYALSDSYAIPHSAAVNAPSFSVPYPPSIRTGVGAAATYTSQQATYQTVTSEISARTVGPGTAAVGSGVISSAGPSWQRNDDDEPAQRKRRWAGAANAGGNQPRRARRIRIQDEVVVGNEERSDEEAEGSHETHTSSSYSDEESSYSYSYSEEDYEYYEEFYEEEVEEDEEDEEEPHIDLIEGATDGHTLHDILYGTPKAGGGANRGYSRELRESTQPDDPFPTASKGKKDPRDSGHAHPRCIGEGKRSRPASDLSPEAAEEAAAMHRRSATPERVKERQRHRDKSAKAHERADNKDGESGHSAVADAGKKHKKSGYEHGEPYTEGTFKGRNTKKSKKAGGHYGVKEDLDEMEMNRDDSDRESSEASHEPITSAARAGKGDRAASYYSSTSDSTDIDDAFTARSGSHARHRGHRPTTKEAKGRHRRHRNGAEGAGEATSTRKLLPKDGGKVWQAEDPAGVPSRQKRAGADSKASEKAAGSAEPDDGTDSSEDDAEWEDGKPGTKRGRLSSDDDRSPKRDDEDATNKEKKSGLLIKCACCSKESANSTMDRKKTGEEGGSVLSEDDRASKRDGRGAKDKKKGGVLRKSSCCSAKADDTKDKGKKKDKERGRDHKDKKKGGVLRKSSCCSAKADDTKDKGKKKDKERGRDHKDKKKGGVLRKSSCCSAKADDTKDKGKKKDKERGRDHKDKKKGGVLIKCACCSKEDDAKAKDKSKGGLLIKCACCSKEGPSDVKDKKKKKGGFCSRLRSFFCMCRGKKSAKDQVADKDKHDDERREADTSSTEEVEGMSSDETSLSTSRTSSLQKSRSASPATDSVDRQPSNRQTNRKRRKTDEVSRPSKPRQAKPQVEEMDATTDPSVPVSPASSASTREKKGRLGDEASAPVSKKAARQPTPRPTPRSTRQARRPHSRTESTGAHRGSVTRSADDSRARGKPEDASVSTPSGVKGVGENHEPSESKSAQTPQQHPSRRHRHRQTRVAEHPKKRSRESRQRKEEE